MHLLFSHMLPSFASNKTEQLDEYEIVSVTDHSSNFDVESVFSDYAVESSWDAESVLSEVERPIDLQADQERRIEPSYYWDSVMFAKPWDIADTAEEQAEIHHSCMSARAINAMALAGRGDAQHTFEDFRSGRRSQRRQHAQAERYWGHRFISHGAVQASRQKGEDVPSKRSVFKAAQEWPRPPKRSHRLYSKDKWPLTSKFEARMDGVRRRHLECAIPDTIWDIEEFDLWQMRWEIATEGVGQGPEVPQVSLLDYIKEVPT